MSSNAWLNADGTMKLDPNLPFTLTIRVHDPLEKEDAKKSACWIQVKVPRSEIAISTEEFVAKYIVAGLRQLKNLKLT